MSNPGMTLLVISFICLLGISLFHFFKHRKLSRMMIQWIVLIVLGGILYALFYDAGDVPSKGGEFEDIYFLIVLYFFMILGMFAKYGYDRFNTPKAKRVEFDLGLMLAPIFASPMIFIPLYTAFQNADIDLRPLTSAKFSLFLVAFQNGFLWKDYFDKFKKEVK